MRARIPALFFALCIGALVPAIHSRLAAAQAPAQSAAPETPPLAGIAHVGLGVSDFDKARAFLSKLGYEQVFELTGNGPTEAYIEINDRQYIELYLRSASQPSTPSSSSLQLCFETPDVQALHDAYAARGLNPSAAAKGRAGNVLFSVRDPEGHHIEFLQYLPSSLHMQDAGKHLSASRISDRLLRAVVVARDLAAERDFYVNKLGFTPAGPGTDNSIVLKLPGQSGDEVEIRTVEKGTLSEMVFTVPDIRHTGEDLQNRGFGMRVDAGTIYISDPDGNIFAFVAMPPNMP